MKKLSLTIISIVLFAFIAASCSNPPVVILPPIDHSTPYDVDNTEELVDMILTQGSARLTSDILIDETITLPAGKNDIEIDLNDHNLELKMSGTLEIKDGSVLTLKNGNFKSDLSNATNLTPADVVTKANLYVNTDSSLILENVTYEVTGTGIGVWCPNGNVSVIDSTLIVDGGYGVSTNASKEYNSTGINISIINSNIKMLDADSCGVMLNVGGTLTIENSTIEGGRQAVIVRNGKATISDSTLISNGTYDGSSFYITGTWGGGNEVPFATLVAGDVSPANYNYQDVECTVINSSLIMNSNNENAFQLYLASDNTSDESEEYTDTTVSIDADLKTTNYDYFAGSHTKLVLNEQELSNSDKIE